MALLPSSRPQQLNQWKQVGERWAICDEASLYLDAECFIVFWIALRKTSIRGAETAPLGRSITRSGKNRTRVDTKCL
jgi:hypothetical protein